MKVNGYEISPKADLREADLCGSKKIRKETDMSVNLSVYKPDAAEMALIDKYGFSVSERDSHFVVRHPGHKKLGAITGGNLYNCLCQMAEATIKLEEFRMTRRYKKTAPKSVPVTLLVATPTAPKIDGGGSQRVESVPPVVGQPKEPERVQGALETVSTPTKTTYYVDAEEGNDNNDGEYSSTVENSNQGPWRTLDHATNMTTPETISGVVLDDSGGKVKKAKKEPKTRRDPSKLKFFSAFKLWLVYPDKEPEFIRNKLAEQGILYDTTNTLEMLRHMSANVVKAMIDLEFVTAGGMKHRREFILSEQKAKEE